MTFTTAFATLAGALTARGYDQPTPVQAAVLAEAAAGRDLLVSAQTGSGKTVAFGLAMAADLMVDTMLPRAAAPLALVVAPTRELAQQVQSELTWLYAGAQARIVGCVGGMDPRREQRDLAAGAHIVVGTPGRLRDHLERRQLDLSALRVVVLDEADEMLDLGFREELEFLLEAMPAGRRTLLFSATLPPAIVSMARRFQRDALRLDSGDGRRAHDAIDYRAVLVAPGETTPAVINVLRHDDAPLAIVFGPTRDAVRTMAQALTARGFSAVALSGEMGQNERNAALDTLRAGRARVCVATDVAARGLDLPALSLVIHAELPMNAQLLLHRSGRTGRAGRRGESVVLVQQSRRRRAEAMLAEAGVTARWEAVPDPASIRARDQERILAETLAGEPASDAETILVDTLLARHDARTVALAMLRQHRALLPEPADVTVLGLDDRRTPRAPAAPRDRGERPERAGPTNPVWLSASVGRRDKADPKWLLPLLCRTGQVTRDEIGMIRVLPTETRFEVAAEAVEQFLAVDPAVGNLTFTRSHPPAMPDRPGYRGRQGKAPRPNGSKPQQDFGDRSSRRRQS